jgi:hypothetical protein
MIFYQLHSSVKGKNNGKGVKRKNKDEKQRI